MNTKPFDLEAASGGARICTRGGCPARFIAYRHRLDHSVFAMFIDKDTWRHYAHYLPDGRYSPEEETGLDLMMVTDEKGDYIYE